MTRRDKVQATHQGLPEFFSLENGPLRIQQQGPFKRISLRRLECRTVFRGAGRGQRTESGE